MYDSMLDILKCKSYITYRTEKELQIKFQTSLSGNPLLSARKDIQT